MNRLDPKYVWSLFLKSIVGMIFVLPGFAIFFIFVFSELLLLQEFRSAAIVFINLILLSLLLFIPYIYARLTYRFYLYELRDDGFRKENGIIWKRYVTIPYERIQNVDIYRGVIDRLLGLSELHIQTAGGTVRGGTGISPEGNLPGLSAEVAEQVRDELILKAKYSNSGGL